MWDKRQSLLPVMEVKIEFRQLLRVNIKLEEIFGFSGYNYGDDLTLVCFRLFVCVSLVQRSLNE